MITNYYNASNNYASPIRKKEPKPYEKPEICEPVNVKNHSIDMDKTLLLGILAVLYLTECRDIWLMLALLYLALG